MAKMTRFATFFMNSGIQYYLHRLFWFGSFLKKLRKAEYAKILEIGSGVGFTSKLLAEKYQNAQITAIDFDEDSIRVAKNKQHSSKISFEWADATNLTYPDNNFDAVFSSLVLHHIKDFEKAISEMVRVVRPGGDIFIMDIPSASFNFTHFRRKFIPGVFTKQDLLDIGKKITFI